MSRHGFDCPMEVGVATPFLSSDLGGLVGQKGGRDMGLMSRPGLVVQEVATWERCRDLAWGRLPGRVATNARLACERPAHVASATCA